MSGATAAQARRPFADRVRRDNGPLQTDALSVNGRFDGSTALIRALPAVPSLIYPTANATDVVTTRAFEWTAVQDADAYILYIGTTPGAYDVLAAGLLTQHHLHVGATLPPTARSTPRFARASMASGATAWSCPSPRAGCRRR